MDITALATLAREFWVVWLMAMFLAIIGWTFWPKRRGELEAHGRIPLDDEEER
jgi:cbb3-type cytochrome oxidase subunit 3